jgi:HK97 gp10 family phage protein
MAKTFSVGIVGADELRAVFQELADDFGPKDSRRILISGVREAMKPALETAKANVPVNTGALRESLRIEARRPNKRMKASKYIDEGDTVVATVTTAPGKVLAKKTFYNYKESYKQRKDVKTKGIESDARAIAAEFGTAHVAPQPFLRSALESNSNVIVNNLSTTIKTAIDKYKARQARKAMKG